MFEEGRRWDWNTASLPRHGDIEEYFVVHIEPEVENSTSVAPVQIQIEEHAARTPGSGGMGTPGNSAVLADAGSIATNQSSVAEMPESTQFETPQSALRMRSLDELYDETSPSWTPIDMDHVQQLELCMLGEDEPTHHTEALKHESWKAAMKDELKSIEDNETWELTTLPAGARPIGLKWVFKLKKDAAGNTIRHKARLVAKGYVQRRGIDFDEVFAPVARLETVRLLIAVAAQEGWEIHHLDVKSAFLNGELEEEVYVVQTPGFEQKESEEKVFKLRKALYGLRQAPRAWNIKLDRSLISLGFVRSPLEHAVYVRSSGGARLLVGVYVDDLVVTGSNIDEVKKFKKQMLDLFSMSDLGLLSYYLGIEVKQSEEGIKLSQTSYASKILEKTGMLQSNTCQVPMEQRLKLRKSGEGKKVDATYYRSVVGSLRYLVNTRPDLAYSVGIVSRYMECPTSQHLAAVKQILRYIRGTLNLGCSYVRKSSQELNLLGYSDSDHAGDTDDCKSTTGVMYFLGGCPISWLSQKQKVVALSSCEAEYIAAATAACQGVWLSRLLAEMTGKEPVKVQLLVDNKSAISLSKNPVHHDRSKHIDTRYHYIRECVEDGRIEVEYTATGDQLADILTKSLGRLKFHELRSRIGMVSISEACQD